VRLHDLYRVGGRIEGHAVIAKLDLGGSLLEKTDWIARRKKESKSVSLFVNSIFSSSRFCTGSRRFYCECRLSGNGESIILNLLIQGYPEVLYTFLTGVP
jgi:hypothetical protein